MRRLVASALMMLGVGLFGTFGAVVAAWFLGPGEQRQDQPVERLANELRESRSLIKREPSPT